MMLLITLFMFSSTRATGEPFRYVGCYKDDSSRDLDALIVGRSHTPESCSNACSGYPYFAVQDGSWCVCGHSYATEAKYSKVGDGECGSAGTGAAWRNSVYEHVYEPFTYVGCYKDDSSRDLDALIVGRSHTPESCSNVCSDYPYFAVQDGSWCVCGNSYATEAKYSKVDDGECGSAGTGAAWRNSVYGHAYEPFTYVGCYKDDSSRDLDALIVGRSHTPESCSNACSHYPYFAVQDGSWCVCGNSYATEAKYSKVGDGECGSAGTGAAWRNSVYEHAYEINYHVANSQMNLPTARSYCYSKGGFLAKPRNEADRNFIRALLPSGNVRAWLGIHQTNGMTWLRDSGDSMGWTNWKSGEGNDRRGVNAGAAMVWQSGWSGEWYDMPNNDGRLHYVVCELPGSSDLANVDYSTCQWHEINQWKKEIHSDDGIPDNFFGFECPPNQIIADLRLQRIDESHLHNDPIAIYCCELGGHGVVTDTCIDRWASETDDGFETAICEGNSAMVAVFDVIDEQTMPDLPQTEWQYSHTKGVTCCDVKYNTAHGIKNDFGINRSDCALISAEKDEDEFDVRCPEDMVLVGVEDHHDLLPGVQGMYSIECCGLHDFAAPTQAPSTSEPSKAPTPSPTDSPTTSPSKSPTPSPTQAPITSEPSLSPTTSCDDCLDKVHAKEIADPSCFRREVQACLDLCCVMEY